jgi:hypothetical protein
MRGIWEHDLPDWARLRLEPAEIASDDVKGAVTAGALRLAEADRDPKLELGEIALAEPKRAAQTLRVSDRAWRRPVRAPLAVGLGVKFGDRLTGLVGCPPLPSRPPPLRIPR